MLRIIWQITKLLKFVSRSVKSNRGQEVQRAVAFAIAERLDVVEAYPALMDMDVELMEKAVETYVHDVNDRMVACYLTLKTEKTPKQLRSSFLKAGVNIPPDQLLGVCEFIKEFLAVEHEHILDFPDFEKPYLAIDPKTNTALLAPEGDAHYYTYGSRSLWYSKMNITVENDTHSTKK